MLTLARESRGWTQKNLADATGLSQAIISQYELGLAQVSEIHAAALSSALRYEIVFFQQQATIDSLGKSLIFHRKRARVPVKIQRRLKAELNIRKMQVAQLTKSATADVFHTFPLIPPEQFNGNAERVARELRHAWNIPQGPIRDLTRIVEANGGIVIVADFGTPLVDGAHLWEHGLPPIFFMNSERPGERERFSLAHELGHAIMHHASIHGEIEDEANAFASELLMPRADIRNDLRSLTIDRAARLKKVWRVSMQALIMKARSLRLISESARTKMFSVLSARGYRINEPWPLPMEEPSLFGKLVLYHKDELGFSEEQMAKVLFTESLGPMEPPERRVPQLRIADNREGDQDAGTLFE